MTEAQAIEELTAQPLRQVDKWWNNNIGGNDELASAFMDTLAKAVIASTASDSWDYADQNQTYFHAEVDWVYDNGLINIQMVDNYADLYEQFNSVSAEGLDLWMVRTIVGNGAYNSQNLIHLSTSQLADVGITMTTSLQNWAEDIRANGEVNGAIANAITSFTPLVALNSQIISILGGRGDGSNLSQQQRAYIGGALLETIVLGITSPNASTKKEGLSQSHIDEILSTPKGQRPDPSTYLTQAEIDEHMAKFDDGAVRFTPRKNINKYGTTGGGGGICDA